MTKEEHQLIQDKIHKINDNIQKILFRLEELEDYIVEINSKEDEG